MTSTRDEWIFGLTIFGPMIGIPIITAVLFGYNALNIGTGIFGAVVGLILAKLELVFRIVKE